MAGDPSVTKTQLDAARSVFSFRASEPPRPPREFEPIPTRGRAIVGLRDILTFAEEIGALDALLPDDAILRAADRLRERRVRATGESDRTDPPAEDEAALQRGLRRGAGASRHTPSSRLLAVGGWPQGTWEGEAEAPIRPRELASSHYRRGTVTVALHSAELPSKS
jgi:hypothetical protein